MQHIAIAIEQSTGTPYGGCPWRVFARPLVADCVAAYSWWGKKQLHTFVGPNPPAKFLAAFDIYQRTVRKLQADESERQRKKEERANQQGLKHRARTVRRG